jgi:hypothetical protein
MQHHEFYFQLVHLADRYKVLNPEIKLSDLSPEDLVKLGLVLCGFKKDDIKTIDPINYRYITPFYAK